MRQTLFTIPSWVFDGPLLIAWMIISVLVLVWLYRRHGNAQETWSFLPVVAVVALVIQFVLPMLQVDGINPDDPAGDLIKRGLAVRGYGVFLVLAIGSGVAIILSRCNSVGLTYDQVIGLGFWMMVAGIAGARVFYVVQKSDEFLGNNASLAETVWAVVDMTKGGLVVYGSLIGAMIAGVAYLKLNKLPLARTADLIAPGMVLGLAIGRIGCLMNGCCYGGICDAPLPSVTFPAGSVPYMKQLSDGELVGITSKPNPNQSTSLRRLAVSIEPGSIADQLGLKPGDEYEIQMPNDRYIRYQKENPGKLIGGKNLVGVLKSERLGQRVIPVADLSARSLATHPAQIYSAINAGLLCLVLWFYWTIRKFDGEVFALMLILYSIGRFLM